MLIKTLADGSVASYVDNYMDANPDPDPVDGPPEEKIRNAHFDTNLLATVAMDYGPPVPPKNLVHLVRKELT